ncbi:MAG: magnesium transporter [Bacillota bacterium]|nr:magnesium transporter [Bacillota bacterium]
MDLKERLERLEPFIATRDYPAIAAVLAPSASIDIAAVLNELDEDFISSVLQYLPSDITGEVLSHLDPELVPQIIRDLGDEKSAAILETMFSDDVADILGELSVKEQNRVFDLMEEEDVEDVKGLLVYPEDTAGSIMTTEFVALNKNVSAEEAINILREKSPSAETVYYVYVVDDDDVLVGVLSLRDLIVTPPNWTLEHIMHTRVKFVTDYMDQEEVANIVSRYDIMAVPVVDSLHRLVGIITVDDVLDVIQAEATEDVLRLAGVHQDELDEDESFLENVITSVKSRLPWLVLTLFGGILAGIIMGNLEAELQAVVALSYFIPLLCGMGGSTGTQSSTVTVRGLSTGQIDASEFFTNIFRESCVGFIVGIFCALVLAVITLVWQGNFVLGILVGCTLICNMILAATIGTLVPLALKKFGADPAVASAPFISTSIDVLGLIIYSVLSYLFMPLLLGIS